MKNSYLCLSDQVWSKDEIPLVSIFCITYNQENYIENTIQGFLSQRTNFKVEIIIGEDCSQDKTLAIIHNYINRYPNLIKVINSEKNVGFQLNAMRTFKATQGKYIAMCEGDDYWIDPYKLQQQVELLQKNPNLAFCFHNAKCIYENNENNENNENLLDSFPGIKENLELTIEDFLIRNYATTLSVLFESKYFFPIPDCFEKIYYGDYANYLLILFRSNKKAYYLKDSMGVYRIHNKGVFSSLSETENGKIMKIQNFLSLYKILDKEIFKGKFKAHTKKIINYHYSQLIFCLYNQKKYFKACYYIIILISKDPFYIFKKLLIK